MIETQSLILDKAKFSDWKEMYDNVLSRPESARYMAWDIATSEEDARIRIRKTITFQKGHDTYLVYEKSSGRAIGFAGVEEFRYSTREENRVSNLLAKSLGFALISSEHRVSSKDGCCYNLLQYSYKMNTAHKGEL